MKKQIGSLRLLKLLFLVGLLVAPMLAFNARADEDNQWSPFIVFDDGNGPYAYFNEPQNWSFGAVPVYTDPNTSQNERVMINGSVGSYINCVITNDTQLYQLIMGASGSGAGNLIITNGAHVTMGVGSGQWTGVGFPNGPAMLIIETNCSLTLGSHLWVGQGTNNGAPAQGTVIIDGGWLSIPNGQLGVGWNGTGGTNFITLTNGGRLFLQQWAAPTLGLPGNNSLGIMNLADNTSYVVVTNNATGFFNGLVANNQLIAYGGQGKVNWNYNPSLNITTISATAPTNEFTPVISGAPTNAIVSLGGTASFHVDISNVSVNYQWLFNGNPVTDGGGISGSHTATITITGVTLAQLGTYSVIATNQTHSDQFTTSTSATLSTMGINLFPVVTINGVPGSTYVAQYTTSLTPPITWTPFVTNTPNSFAPVYVVDTNSPMSIKRFYRVIQQ
jgi:hypothetical protein